MQLLNSVVKYSVLSISTLIGHYVSVGESSGKASKGVVKYTAGMGQMQEKMGMATSEIGRAKMVSI